MMVKAGNRLRIVMAAFFAVLIATTIYAARIASARESALIELTHETSIKVMDDLMADLRCLRVALHRYRTGDLSQQAEVTESFERIRSGVKTLQAGSAERIGSNPTGLAALIDFDQSVAALGPSDIDLSRPGNGTRIQEFLARLESLTGTMIAVAASDRDRDVLRNSADFNAAFYGSQWLGAFAMLCGAGAFALFLRTSAKTNALAQRDALTGLPNRRTFSQTLAAKIDDPGPGNEVALLLIDIDLFKNVNDTMGHAAGDLLLTGIVSRLAGLSKNGGVFARLGGDEFAVLLTARSAYREATNMADAILALMKEPFWLEGKRVTVGLSIGIASPPAGWCDGDTLLKNADIALYAAKAAGRGAYRFFSPRMDRDLRKRREMEEDLREAVAARQIALHFQPIVDLRTQRIINCEALARWHHPRHGAVPPLRFIALAEEIGLIRELGDWIIESACTTAQTWPAEVAVSINISSHQFEGDGLVSTLTRVLGETGIAPGRIELEITETVLLRDNDHVLRVLAALKDLGVRIALDDFGTGYSSLAYLQRFPIDKLKIDQSFVQSVTSKPEAAAIVESLVLLAHKLGLTITAEGVETEAHASVLRAMGCDEGQGYHFDKPLTADTCLSRLAGQDARQAAA